MADLKWFLHQVKHTNDNWDKGIVVKDSLEGAKQGFHAYLGAYAYDHDPNTSFVQCMITNSQNMDAMIEMWTRPEPEPEPAPEPEPEAQEEQDILINP